MEKENKNQENLELVKQSLTKIQSEINKLVDLLSENSSVEQIVEGGEYKNGILGDVEMEGEPVDLSTEDLGEEKVIEGVFDGQNMVGADGKRYTVPANYASKSKLVEGDILKLTIQPDGSFVFKQISPIERKRIIGKLEQDEATHQFYVKKGNKKWKVLTASVTFFRGEAGDEVIILVPQKSTSQWGAVENIIKKGE